MTIWMFGIILGIIVAAIGFIFGYFACPILTVGSVVLQQIGTPAGKYGIVKMPGRKSVCGPIMVFTGLGFVIGAIAGGILGIAMKLPWS